MGLSKLVYDDKSASQIFGLTEFTVNSFEKRVISNEICGNFDIIINTNKISFSGVSEKLDDMGTYFITDLKINLDSFKIIETNEKCCCNCDGIGTQGFAWIYCTVRSEHDEEFDGDCGETLGCNQFTNVHPKD